jgi:hypothetical protein
MRKIPEYGDDVLDMAIAALYLIAKEAKERSVSIMDVDGEAFMEALMILHGYPRSVRRECERLIRKVNPDLELMWSSDEDAWPQ